MNTGYGWEGIRQVCATLLGACHVPERLASKVAVSTWGAITRLVFDLYLYYFRIITVTSCGAKAQQTPPQCCDVAKIHYILSR